MNINHYETVKQRAMKIYIVLHTHWHLLQNKHKLKNYWRIHIVNICTCIMH